MRTAALAFVGAALLTAMILWLTVPVPTVGIRVRWQPGASGPERESMERRFALRDGRVDEGATWVYTLADYSRDNIRALVQHPAVSDTHGVDRARFQPDPVPPGRAGSIALRSMLAGAGALLLVVVARRLRREHLRVRVVAPVSAIAAVVTLTYLPVLTSGDRLLFNDDFFQYASRHESVAQSIRQFGALPLRSHWLGGGFHTIADPEDPTLNPLVLFSVVLGAVNGIKAIGYLSMLIGGLSTYAFARRILGYTEWGALFSALVFGICLFVPARIAGGNPNEVYGAWLPLCLLLIGLARPGRRWPVIVLSVVFYTMVSDGKLTALMAFFYIGLLCAAALVPPLRIFPGDRGTGARFDYGPLTCFLTALALAIVISLPRLLPAFEVILDSGGIAPMIAAHPQVYSPEGVNAYSFDELWKGAVGWDRRVEPALLNRDLVTVGTLPVVLAGITLLVYWRQALPWMLLLLLFCWLILAHHAPVDLLAALWNLPIFDTIYRPYKYFSFQIAFTLAILAGRSFDLLREMQPRRVEALLALILTAFSVGFLYPRASAMLSGAFTREEPDLPAAETLFQVAEQEPGGAHPRGAVPYFNLRRGIGTLSGFTPVPVPTTVAPRFLVSEDDRYVENPAYRGEAYVLDEGAGNKVTAAVFESNAMSLSVELTSPAMIVINQNYHRDWHADRGMLLAHDGLLAVRLTEPGAYAVRFRYHPRSFYAGVALTALALLAAVVFRRSWYTDTRPPSSA